MTLNGVTTGDARYLCSSWASCKLVCKMQTSCEFLEYCHFLHLVGRPTTVTTFYRDPFDFYRTSDISMSAQRRPEKSVRGWVISQGQQIDWDILLISPEILQEIKSLKIDLEFFLFQSCHLWVALFRNGATYLNSKTNSGSAEDRHVRSMYVFGVVRSTHMWENGNTNIRICPLEPRIFVKSSATHSTFSDSAVIGRLVHSSSIIELRSWLRGKSREWLEGRMASSGSAALININSYKHVICQLTTTASQSYTRKV